MTGKRENRSVLPRLLDGLGKIFQWLRRMRRQINQRMRRYYSSAGMALWATLACALLMVIMLFIPSYLGTADDGSAQRVLGSAGLRYLEEDSQDPAHYYFVRTYQKVVPDTEVVSVQMILLRGAMLVDDFFTRDSLFDIRFLALLYFLLLLPSVWMVFHAALSRVRQFTEALVIAVLGVLLFADVTYVSYLNSLYPEAIWYIGMCMCTGAGLSLAGREKYAPVYMGWMLCGVLLLAFSRQAGAVAGVFFSIFLFLTVRSYREQSHRFLAGILAVVMLGASVAAYFVTESGLSIQSKFHSMTRGVLLQSEDPEEALAEFEIAPQYAMLTDVSAYDGYALTRAENAELEEGFYDHYSELSVAFYYVRHPFSMLSMLDLATKSAMNIAREYCGNYEREAGHEPMARSVFWAGASIFKVRSAPHTLGYLAVLIVAYFLLLRRRKISRRRRREEPQNRIWLLMMVVLTFIGIGVSIYAIIGGGDTQLVQYSFFLGAAMDLIVFYIAASGLNRLNILEDKEE